MQNESTKNIGFSMKAIDPGARRDADMLRIQREEEQMKLPDGRKRLRRGEPSISISR